MTRRVNLSIRTRLTLMMALVTTLVLALGLALVLTSRIRLLKEEMTRHALVQAQLLGQNCISALDFGYVSDAVEALKKIQADPEIEGASLFDSEGKPFASFGKVGPLSPLPGETQERVVFESTYLAVLVPISYRDRRFGSLLLQTSTARLETQISDAKRRFVVFSLLMGILSLGLAHLFQKTLTGPILSLASMARQVAEKNDYSLRIESQRMDELGVLFDDFNLMLGQIQAQTIALRESEAWSRMLIEITAQGFWQLDAEGRTVNCNQAHAELLGRERADIIGRSALDFIPENARAATRELLAQRQTQEKRSYDITLERSDGEPVPVHVNATNLRGQDGTFLGSFAMITDLTERVRAESMRLARDAAEAAALSKSEFLANMSHEIRTPMNAILGFVGLALRQDLAPKVRDYLEKVNTSGQSLLGIINDILDFSKIEAGKLELEATPFRLSDVLKQVGDLFSHRAAEAGLDFSVSMGAAVPDCLIGDPLRLGQILINLAGNALKFTSEGHVQVRVEHLRRVGEEAHLWFYVQDTGIGMSEEQRSRLFQAFSQADSSTTRQFGGTGLGLSIAQRLVEKMGGEIVVLSALGKGSTFAFSARFPLDFTLAPRPIRSPGSLRGKRVLVVDDSPVIREILVEQLWSFEMEARSVASGAEALTALKADAFDVVLMDWRMPGMDGLETSQRIRAQAAPLPPPAIIMVTAYGREDLAKQAEATGFSAFLVKPISPPLLMDTLLDVLPTEGVMAGNPSMGPKTSPQAPSLLGLRVLVVDDNPINLEVAQDLLATEGIIVEVAQSGTEAIQLVEKKAFHAVFMDIQMPEMDGYEATKRIRANPRRAALPIIAMTAHALPRYRDLCLAAGMNDFITKPIDPDKLMTTLAYWTIGGTLQIEGEPKPEPSLRPLLDTTLALQRLRGNEPLLRRLLVDFKEQLITLGALLRHSLETRDTEGLEQGVHSIKGVAGTIGALRLQADAGLVEDLLREGSRATAWDVLEGLAETVQATLATLGAEPQSEPPAPPAQRPPVDPAALLENLVLRLSTGDPSAEDLLQDFPSLTGAGLDPKDLPPLEAAVRNFDFGQALRLLEPLTQGKKKSGS